MKVSAEIPKKRVIAPALIRIHDKSMTVVCLKPVPIKTKHPSLALWNAKAIMWGQG